MEGFLMVPPERNSLLGKTNWKARFVSVAVDAASIQGTAIPRPSSSSRLTFGRRNSEFSTLNSPNPSTTNVDQLDTEVPWLMIYKQRGDAEPVAGYSLASLQTCIVADYSHRKGEQATPTLVVVLRKDKNNIRRSSQSHTLSRSKSGRTTTLLFRSMSGQSAAIHEWQQILQAHIPPSLESPKFASGFSFGGRERPTLAPLRPGLSHSPHSYYSAGSGQYLSITSPNPDGSVGSAWSDVSSSYSTQTSYFSRTPSSPILDAPLTPLAEGIDPLAKAAASPVLPTPRESILDRAFKMKRIPGATADDDNADSAAPPLTSIQRFEALMHAKNAQQRQQRREEKPALPSPLVDSAVEPSSSDEEEPISPTDISPRHSYTPPRTAPAPSASANHLLSASKARDPRPSSLILASSSISSISTDPTLSSFPRSVSTATTHTPLPLPPLDPTPTLGLDLFPSASLLSLDRAADAGRRSSVSTVDRASKRSSCFEEAIASAGEEEGLRELQGRGKALWRGSFGLFGAGEGAGGVF